MKEKSMKVFKVRDMVTGLYKLGTTQPRWSQKGKTWLSLGALKAHLTSASKYKSQGTLNGIALWEIIEYELAEVEKYPASAIKFGRKEPVKVK